MFGYLPAPCRCQIGDQVELYRSAFCGLCNALAGRYGQPARLLINRDSTFAALLAAAQTEEEPDATLSARCQRWRSECLCSMPARPTYRDPVREASLVPPATRARA